MVSIGSALKDAPRMAREAGKMLFVLGDSLQRDQALVSDKAPQRGGRYNVLAMYTPTGDRVDYCGPVMAETSIQAVAGAQDDGPVGRKIAVEVAKATQSAEAQAANDAARERAVHEIDSLRDDLLAMLDLVTELEQRGVLEVQDVLDALGHAADTCYETTCSDD